MFETTSLKWHYRSRSEELITFSNKAFYDWHLITIPQAKQHEKGFGVDFYHVPEGRYDMSTFGSGDAIFTFDDNNNELMIKTGSQISLFDTKAWVETASIYNVLCYHKASDRFYVYSYFISSECTPGYIKHYTLADLIEKAKRYLHGHELDEVTKTKYGL